MPKYPPNTRFSDCWSSAGEVTFYHRNGECFWKNKAHPVFAETPAQLDNADLHRRALNAWRSLDPEQQLVWNSYARSVQSHRPPFIADHHISGYNLFVAAYHGFAQLGDEHVPVPAPWKDFPVVWVGLRSAAVINQDTLKIKLRVKLGRNVIPSRYRLLLKLQLTRPGAGRQPGYLRNFLAAENCRSLDGTVEVLVPNYRDIWELDLKTYQVHCRYLLIDSETGYRNNFRKKSFLMSLPE
ncbi:MAG: hypothetical protein MJY55_05440 [Bacteroidales bacterium]|nr:hypothetical protein [Bacteroidales bacterium]